MSDRTPDLTALVGSRICHDLISPIGAIANGVELLGMSGVAQGPEMQLISESVENANARIKFFRIAFGAASDDSKISETEVIASLNAVSQGGRVEYDWKPQGAQSRVDVRLVFLALQCLESAMAYGGAIMIEKTAERWTLTATADKFKTDPALWERLYKDDTSDLPAAAHVQFALLPGFLIAAGRNIEYTLEDRQIVITL
ncbi:histidine phosphotransferase family protein [Parasulfitobacter algicola]|uniref:Histidine phosphotransferase n=1 Tax=Parasulfitobacter algicola TaxID=2614809 RepID=A0ABX2IQY0_9RHOB|nr:histidine phosphotransferase family protein [Sulfitobacter algicola]NSX55278.1 histidine phosphotransferase [Sulfitobacter algicola]